jgi:hypothetical protein
MREFFRMRFKAGWVVVYIGLAILASPPAFAQQDDAEGESVAASPGEGSAVEEDEDEDEEDRVRVEENVFIPSEEISQDNAVPFPVDI